MATTRTPRILDSGRPAPDAAPPSLVAGSPVLTDLQRHEIAYCGRKAESCLRLAQQATEDAAIPQYRRRLRQVSREARQDAREYSAAAFQAAQPR